MRALGRRWARLGRKRSRPSLESLEQRRLLATFVVNTTSDLLGTTTSLLSGSLRQAITDVDIPPVINGVVTPITEIDFSIDAPTGGKEIINLLSPLPTIQAAVKIDGLTQPGVHVTPLIQIDGSNAGTGANGLKITSGNVQVLDLAIVNFSGSGIVINGNSNTLQQNYIGLDANQGGGVAGPNGGFGIVVSGSSNIIGGQGTAQTGGFTAVVGNFVAANAKGGIDISGANSSRNVIQGNIIGTDNSGSTALPNQGDGIIIDGGFNLIGGTTGGTNNVISGNTGNGIHLTATAKNTSIEGNLIGVGGLPSGGSTSGTVAVPNGAAGILIAGASQTAIGGTPNSEGNVISGNTGPGISIVSGGNGNVIEGNDIGTDLTGALSLGNGGSGILVNGSAGTVIGGSLAGAANTIANNGFIVHRAGGVEIDSGSSIPILNNSIFNNSFLGIILGATGNGPNQNDFQDPDQGPNQIQNYPVLSFAGTASGQTRVRGTFNSTPNSTYTIQLFANNQPNPSNFGEGQIFVGQVQVTTDAGGDATIDAHLTSQISPGQFISATATDSQGNTSEFSKDQVVAPGNLADVSVAIAASPSPATQGAPITYTVTVTDNGPKDVGDVTFDELFPPALTVSAVSLDALTISTDGHEVSGDLGTIATKTSLVFTITATPSVSGTFATTATATVASDEIDTNTGNNSATNTTVVEVPVDLGLTLMSRPAGESSVTVGQDFTAVAVVLNNGPGVATGTIVTMVLPAGTSFLAASTGQGDGFTFTPDPSQKTGGTLKASLGSISRGSVATVRVTFTVPSQVPASGTITLTSTVTEDQLDSDATNNSASLPITILPSSDLDLTFTGTPQPILAGGNLTLSYSVTNNGPSPATNVVLTSNIPASFNFLAAPNPTQGNATFSGGVLLVNMGALASGQTVSGTVTVQPTLSGNYPTTATLTLDQPDPDTSNNSVTFTSIVSPADLSVNVQAAPAPVEAGRNLTYTVFVTNNGPADAANAKLVDALPAGVTFLSAAPGQGTVSQSGGTLTALLGTIISGQTVPVTIVVSSPVTGLLSNTATVSSDEFDQNAANNAQTVNTFVSPADLAVQLSVSPSVVLTDSPFTYTALVTNAGPSTATNVNFADSLPAGLTFVSASTSSGAISHVGNAVTANLGSIPSGGSATITIVASASTNATYNDTATVSSDQVDPVSANNTTQVGVTVTNAPGVLQFAAQTFAAPENSGFATITVTRQSGNLGTVTVNFHTFDNTGVAGTNYVATAGTLTFLNGVTTQTFSVPLIDDGVVNGSTTIGLALSSPGGGATLGAASATLVAAEADFDVTGPTVTDVEPMGTGKAVTGLVLTFDEALDPTNATNPNNYTLLAPSRNGRGETRVATLPPTYDALNHTVTITAGRALPLNTFFHIDVSPAVTDIFGNELRGDSSLVNGHDFAATFARGSSLKYIDGNGDLVSLNLSNGGLLDLYRNASGEGQVLTVLGAGPRRSVLTGTVRKGGPASDGVSTFQSIIGANFGQVNSHLTTPKFFVDEVSAFIKGSSATNITASRVVKAASASVAVKSAKTARVHLFARSHKHRFHSR